MALEFKGVKKVFKKKIVLNNVSFKVMDAEIFGVIGKSGAGKSTITKILVGMLKEDGGEIWLNNKKVKRDSNKFKKKIGVSTQFNTLHEELTLLENVLYYGRLYGKKKKEIIKKFESLSPTLKLDRSRDSKVSELSGGMKKRAGLLVSLIHSPSLLILDEPTVGLDSKLRKEFWKYINKINKEEKIMILVISHLLDEVENNCHRIGIMKDGKIYAKGTMKQLKKAYGERKNLEDIFELLI